MKWTSWRALKAGVSVGSPTRRYTSVSSDYCLPSPPQDFGGETLFKGLWEGPFPALWGGLQMGTVAGTLALSDLAFLHIPPIHSLSG